MIINLTPHKLVLILGHGSDNPLTMTYSSAGVARVEEHTVPAGDHEMIPIMRTRYGEVTGLPDPQEDVIYVTSAMVRLACPDRQDVASPGGMIRDEQGRVVAASYLIVNEDHGEVRS